MATFGELQSKVSTRLKDPSNTSVSVSDVAATINEAIQFWSRERFWFDEFEESVALVQDDPDLPALSVTPKYLFETNGIVIDYASTRWPVRKISSIEYDEMNAEGRGIPFAWTFRNNGYELYWYPDAAYTAIVRGVKAYADLVDSSDTNDFTTNTPDLVMYEALSRLFGEFLQDPNMESYYSARTQNEFKSIKNQTRRGNASGRIHVRGF